MNTEPEKDDSLLYRLKSLGVGILVALPFLGAGMYIMGISFGFLPSDPESFIAPPGVVGLAGAFFVAGGLMVLLYGFAGNSGQKSVLFRVLNNILGLAFVALLGLVFAWVGLGPGERVFEGGISIGPLSIFRAIRTLLGRGVFGIIGLGMLLIALVGILTSLYSGLSYIYHKIRALLTRNPGSQV